MLPFDLFDLKHRKGEGHMNRAGIGRVTYSRPGGLTNVLMSKLMLWKENTDMFDKNSLLYLNNKTYMKE